MLDKLAVQWWITISLEVEEDKYLKSKLVITEKSWQYIYGMNVVCIWYVYGMDIERETTEAEMSALKCIS